MPFLVCSGFSGSGTFSTNEEEYNSKKDDLYVLEESKIIEYVLWENNEKLEESEEQNNDNTDSYESALLFAEDARISSFKDAVQSHQVIIADTIFATASYNNKSNSSYEES